MAMEVARNKLTSKHLKRRKKRTEEEHRAYTGAREEKSWVIPLY